MDTTLEVLRIASQVMFALVGLAAVVQWRRRGGESAAWLAATFGALAFVVLAGRVFPDEPPRWLSDVLVASLALVPYLLFRFMASFGRPSRPVWWLAHVLTGTIIVWSFLLPSFPEPGEPRPALFQAYIAAFLIQWTILSTVVVWRLWRAGRGQSTVTRRRMRTLAVGSVFLNGALLVAGLVPSGDEATVSAIVVQAFALVSGPFFYIGFAPPAILRMAWRRPEEQSLRASEFQLMTALTPIGVADALLPHVAAIFGGRGAVLTDEDGNVVASQGLSPRESRHLEATLAEARRTPEPVEVRPGLLVLDLRFGRLAVESSPFTPFFGRDEIELLREIGTFADLALERTRLVAAERQAREAAEAANAELQGFVYSVSHDLKSPLITLLGYLDYLKIDLGDRLGEEGGHYVERMSASASYMHALINDLLELSRIGRGEAEPEPVDLGVAVSEIVHEFSEREPMVDFEVGPLPVVSLNPIRVRQLFTNLVENAIRYGDRPDLTVRITSELGPDGQVVLSCADNGKGIPEQYRDKVFGVFERLDVEDQGGTGIGLAICRKIVEHAGGSIWIADSDVGADIRMQLPAALAAPTEVTDARARASG